MNQKRALSYVIRKRYQRSGKKEKGNILDEFIENTGYNRSYARRILGSPKKQGRKKKHVVRKRIYDAAVFYPLRTIWIAADGICGKRLKPFILDVLRKLEEFKEIKLNKEIRRKLLSISSSSIDRMLSATKKNYQLKGRSTTKPGTLLRSTIPVRTFSDWDETRPGFFETDLVALCGDSVRGDYVNALNLTDVASGWIGLEAIMGKAQSRVHPAVDNVRNRLPFPMLGLDPDNGTEFINWLLKSYCDEHGINFTRIRPYRKNDNCYVEQKNYTVVRRFLGYARYDTDIQLRIIKEILKLVELYVNFFQPVMRLKEKQRIGSHLKKKYDTAKTPYQKLVLSGILKEGKKQRLQNLYNSLNPLDLKRKINRLTEKLNKTLRYKIRDATNT
ncbi:transposase family protein [Candidatus Gottesmanbacteria bacterium]|nr:transposase family protein [Candidatus Gottesmanbacteria bacterium]